MISGLKALKDRSVRGGKCPYQTNLTSDDEVHCIRAERKWDKHTSPETIHIKGEGEGDVNDER